MTSKKSKRFWCYDAQWHVLKLVYLSRALDIGLGIYVRQSLWQWTWCPPPPSPPSPAHCGPTRETAREPELTLIKSGKRHCRGDHNNNKKEFREGGGQWRRGFGSIKSTQGYSLTHTRLSTERSTDSYTRLDTERSANSYSLTHTRLNTERNTNSYRLTHTDLIQRITQRYLVWPTPGLIQGLFSSSGFSGEGTLISASAEPIPWLRKKKST